MASEVAVQPHAWKGRLKTLAKAALPQPIYVRTAETLKRILEPPRAITPVPPRLKRDDPRYAFFIDVARYLSANRLDGVYTEFGCHGAHTFRYALNTLGNPKMVGNRIYRFYAFDSFEGLPEPTGLDRQKIFSRGRYAMGEEEFQNICAEDLYRITTVKGFYDQTLPHYAWNSQEQIACAYLDCDYHSSTLDALRFLSRKLAHGAILAFDDWNMYYADPSRGQRAAFRDWQREVEGFLHFEPYRPVSYLGTSFICLQKELIGKEYE